MLEILDSRREGSGIMRYGRAAVLVALVVFGTTGCADRTGTTTSPSAGAGSGAPSASGAPVPVAPRDALLGSTKLLAATTFSAKVTYPNSVVLESTIDPATRTGTQKFTGGNERVGFVVEQLNVGGEVFLKYAFRNDPSAPKLPAGWMRVDLSQMKQPDKLALTVPDPARLDEIMPKVGAVERTAERTFTGTVDLRDVGKLGLVNDTSTMAALGDKAAAVPFEATVDDQGRIASFTIKAPASTTRPARTWNVTYSGWGTTLSITKPAAIPAPRTLYVLYNQGG